MRTIEQTTNPDNDGPFADDLPATPITRPAASHQDRADDDEFLFWLTN